MPLPCTVCTSEHRAEIDKALASGVAVKRRMATRLGLGEAAIRRHERRHLDPRLIEAHKRSLEALDASTVRTARQNCEEFLSDLRQCREAFVANGRIVPHRDFLDILDRAIKANEQYGRITKELGNDQVTALFVDLGVRSEAEIRSRLSLSRTGESLSPADAQDEALTTLEMVWAKHPELREAAMRRLDRASYALVESTNGGNGHAPQVEP